MEVPGPTALLAPIGDVDASKDCQDKIDAARHAYDELNADQQALVTNLEDLLDAEAAKEVADLIGAIGDVDASKDCQDKIDETRDAYDELTEEKQDLLLNTNDLLDAEAAKEVTDLIEAINPLKYPDSKDTIEATRDT